jgi:hypothetical protein
MDASRGAGGVNRNYHRSEEAGPRVFQAVVEDDYEGLAQIFATHARNSLVSYMSVKSRWARQQENMAKSGKEEHQLCLKGMMAWCDIAILDELTAEQYSGLQSHFTFSSTFSILLFA